MNLLVLPGLGSFLLGRRMTGVVQALLACTGAGMSAWWLILLARQWAQDGYFPIDGGNDFRIGVSGVFVFAVGWVWSLVTSLAVVREVRRSP
jgi:hypothetical protein